MPSKSRGGSSKKKERRLSEDWAAKEEEDTTVKTYRFGNDRYQGSLDINGNRHGVGTYIWQTGAVYAGHWREGLMHGAGRMTYSNGDVFVGEWADGVITGMGLKKNHSTGSTEEGEYFEGYSVGPVRRRLGNGDRFCGLLGAGDERAGYGEYFWADGYSYKGWWHNDRTHGVGHWEPERGCKTHFSFVRSYSGSFREELRHGFGVAELWGDGGFAGVVRPPMRYEGMWEADLFHGVGKLSFNVFVDRDNPNNAAAAAAAGAAGVGAGTSAIYRVEIDGEFAHGERHGLACVRQVQVHPGNDDDDGARGAEDPAVGALSAHGSGAPPPHLDPAHVHPSAFIGPCSAWNLEVALEEGHDVVAMAHLLRGFEFRGEFEHDEAAAGIITSDLDESVQMQVRRLSALGAEHTEWEVLRNE
jgi:hypothetical protein